MSNRKRSIADIEHERDTLRQVQAVIKEQLRDVTASLCLAELQLTTARNAQVASNTQ